MTNHLKWLALLFACLLGLTADATAAEPVKSPDEWARLVEAAKKEGRLVLYGSADYEQLFGEFQKKYPEIKVTGSLSAAALTLPNGSFGRAARGEIFGRTLS